MSNSFPVATLSEVAQPIQRSIPVIPGTSYRTIGVKWWGEGAYERETIDGIQTSAKTLTLIKENDLIINKIWVRNGSTAIASEKVDGCAASGEFPTFELDQTKILPRWLHWITKTQDFWQKCDVLSRGTSGKNRIRPELFLTIKFPLPPLEEQRRIVARIEELAAKIEEARGLKNSVHKDIRSMLLAEYKILTRNVKLLPMSEVAPLVRRPIQVDLSEQYHELGIRSFGKGTFHKPSIKGTELGTKKIFEIKENDLLFNIVFAWEGAVAVAKIKDDGRVGSHRFLTCVPKQDLATSTFLCFHFLTEQGLEQLLAASPGSAGRNRTLGIHALESLSVPLPPIDKQIWFTSLVNKLNTMNPTHQQINTELDALLPSILDKAFKGEL
jgi:type I restriction enzyme, S subunit